ncbi:MAG: IS4 family transposase [Pseudomonadota bacterium]|nr:IS4 family transposase [Pseudomonadota bacterium]
MPYQDSVLHAVLQQVPWAEFERLCAAHDAERDARGFSAKSQFVALLYAQLAGALSLRDIEAGMSSHAGQFHGLGVVPARRSTLADANAQRPATLFMDLFAYLAAGAGRSLRRDLGGAGLYLVDATVLPLTGRSRAWAHFSAHACGAIAQRSPGGSTRRARARLHVIYDADAGRPVYAALSAAKVNAITAAQAMPVEPGATYVFDLGYYDYAWWAKLDAAGCHLVTRLKANTRLREVQDHPVPERASVRSDRTGLLPARQASRRQNPLAKRVREVCVQTDTGKLLRILTNDLTAPAEAVAALCKRRWAIELFFRWVKQVLRIRHFLGTSENAVHAQLVTALIAYLLLRAAQATQTTLTSPLLFVRLVRVNLLHHRPLHALLSPSMTRPANPSQQSLAPCKP